MMIMHGDQDVDVGDIENTDENDDEDDDDYSDNVESIGITAVNVMLCCWTF